MFTVKQLSSLAGITPRALRHYDKIGLLKPSRLGENGYRYYGEESLLRLQQILFYCELGLPLGEIRKIMGRRDFDCAWPSSCARQSGYMWKARGNQKSQRISPLALVFLYCA